MEFWAQSSLAQSHWRCHARGIHPPTHPPPLGQHASYLHEHAHEHEGRGLLLVGPLLTSQPHPFGLTSTSLPNKCQLRGSLKLLQQHEGGLDATIARRIARTHFQLWSLGLRKTAIEDTRAAYEAALAFPANRENPSLFVDCALVYLSFGAYVAQSERVYMPAHHVYLRGPCLLPCGVGPRVGA